MTKREARELTEISEAAVDAAAETFWNSGNPFVRWEGLDERIRDDPRRKARAALEAAAPHMQGAAWESGYTLGYADCANKQESNRPNPHKEES